MSTLPLSYAMALDVFEKFDRSWTGTKNASQISFIGSVVATTGLVLPSP